LVGQLIGQLKLANSKFFNQKKQKKGAVAEPVTAPFYFLGFYFLGYFRLYFF